MRRRRRVVSDPREIAVLVLETPGLVDKLVDALSPLMSEGELERVHVRATIVRSLVDQADAWPGKTGWAIDNDGDPYPYDRPAT